MTVAFESPDQPEVIALIADLDAYHMSDEGHSASTRTTH